MKCFYYFKDRASSRARKHKSASAPDLRNPYSESNTSDSGNGVRSEGSAAALSRGIGNLYEEKSPNLRVFTFSELSIATNGFDRMLKIGEGGFGSVYRGKIRLLDGRDEPTFVAVKKLKGDGFQGHKQWLAEVQFLGVVGHPNLVKLIGYCAVDGERGIQRLLVYEYMPNKSLGDHLFKKPNPLLTWEKRLHIILGAARGLAYLHEELELQVIFRDFKASNVLLDQNFEAKLSDFGLAREGPTNGQTHVSTAVVGTHGYAAPDYVQTGHLTSKSDVWSFGVVLYEILTGRKSLERNRAKSEQNLLDWVKKFPIDSKKFSSIIDPQLGNEYSFAAAQKIAKLANSCLAKSQKNRPKMSQVVEGLKQIMEAVDDGNSSNLCSPIEDNKIELKVEETGASGSAKRRLAQLVKLSEHTEVEGIGTRKLLIMQKAMVS